MQHMGVVSHVAPADLLVVDLQLGGHAVLERCGGCAVSLGDAVAGRLTAAGLQRLANLSAGDSFRAVVVSGVCADVTAQRLLGG